MAWLFPYLLFLHVAGAILAFGPTFAFGLYADLAEQDRSHIPFNNQARAAVSRRFVVPGTIAMGVTGVLLIVSVGIPLFDPAYRWLQLGILLYLGAITWNVTVTRRHQTRIAELARELAAARERGEPAGPPPPEMAAHIHAVRRDGKAMGIVVLVIVFLMVVKPSLGG
jgi:uncharacterized membrane protein